MQKKTAVLLGAGSRQEALALLDEGLQRFGAALPEMLEAVGRMPGLQGQQELMRRLEMLREAARDRLQD